MKKWFSRYSQQIFLFAAMMAVCMILTAKSEYFLVWRNLRNILEANSYRMILAIGMTFVIASGVMDLSAGAMVSMCGVIMAVTLHMGVAAPAAVMIGILSGQHNLK